MVRNLKPTSWPPEHPLNIYPIRNEWQFAYTINDKWTAEIYQRIQKQEILNGISDISHYSHHP
jgi:hypothetical protein